MDNQGAKMQLMDLSNETRISARKCARGRLDSAYEEESDFLYNVEPKEEERP
jgi:hypothetical protein